MASRSAIQQGIAASQDVVDPDGLGALARAGLECRRLANRLTHDYAGSA